jgi:hypothetical protein
MPATTIPGFVPMLGDDVRWSYDSFPILKVPDNGM